MFFFCPCTQLSAECFHFMRIARYSEYTLFLSSLSRFLSNNENMRAKKNWKTRWFVSIWKRALSISHRIEISNGAGNICAYTWIHPFFVRFFFWSMRVFFFSLSLFIEALSLNVNYSNYLLSVWINHNGFKFYQSFNAQLKFAFIVPKTNWMRTIFFYLVAFFHCRWFCLFVPHLHVLN